MGVIGGFLGNLLGNLGSHFFPIKGVDGGVVGQTIGSNLLPFKKGGKVRRHKVRKPRKHRGKKK
jgi:hypothetical protein